jgi:hypothetical protein
MDRPRILRLLRIAFSVACGIVCLMVIAVWVRSYWWVDAIPFAPSHYNEDSWGHKLRITNSTVLSIEGYRGRAALAIWNSPP